VSLFRLNYCHAVGCFCGRGRVGVQLPHSRPDDDSGVIADTLDEVNAALTNRFGQVNQQEMLGGHRSRTIGPPLRRDMRPRAPAYRVLAVTDISAIAGTIVPHVDSPVEVTVSFGLGVEVALRIRVIIGPSMT
jgi:hypothetical protein